MSLNMLHALENRKGDTVCVKVTGVTGVNTGLTTGQSNLLLPSPSRDMLGTTLQNVNLDTLFLVDPSGPTALSSSTEEAPYIMHHQPGLFWSREAKNREKHRAFRAPANSPTVA